MSPTKESVKSNVVVVGGGYGGIIAAKRLSENLDHTKHNLYLVEARPHHVWAVASARLTVSTDPEFPSTVVLPFDRLFPEGKGIVKQGRVVGIREDENGVGGEIILEDNETLPYKVLVLATGSKWAGPLNFPDGKLEFSSFVTQWREKFRDAKNITLIGAGAVGIEFAGELRDEYPKKKITMIHGEPLVMNSTYPDKFRKYFEDQLRERGIDLLLGDFVKSYPDSGPGEVVLSSGRKLYSDLVILTAGPKLNTDFIASSLGEGALSHNKCVKVSSHLQVLDRPSIFAFGDIIDWPEQKQAAKIVFHVDVVVPNILSFLRDGPLNKTYKGCSEVILVTNGKASGAGYAPFLWGLVFGPWVSAYVKSQNLFRGYLRDQLGYN